MPASDSYALQYQKSPIILTNGVAANMPGGALPIIAITQANDFEQGLLQGATGVDLDSFFADFLPLPGAKLIDQDIAHYPFANQAVAANAVIAKPLVVSLRMICPARNEGDFSNRLNIIINLQNVLAQHNSQGGTYTIATPSYLYTDCVMVSMTDITPGESKQPQTDWQLDFEQPLLTEQQAEQAQSNLMSKISSQTQVNGQPTWSGVANTVGQPPSLAQPSLVPASSGLSGAGVGGLQNPPPSGG